MVEWRLIGLEESQNSFEKMALEEAIMDSVRTNSSPPTLRFYSWNKPAVSIGFFQNPEKELNLENCKKDSIEVFRRITGGGAVFKSVEEINYSFVIREDEPLIPKEVIKSYELICGAIITGLKELGFNPKFKPINDIMILEKKFSGNAQTRINNVLLHHGTILLKVNPKMFSYLNINEQKLLEKKVSKPSELVTGLHDHKIIPKQEIINAITTGFEKTFNKKFVLNKLTKNELLNTKKLVPKYSSKEFVFGK